jgi:hypothetical protein
MFVASVFGEEQIFTDMTGVIPRKSQGPIPSLGLPITAIISDCSAPSANIFSNLDQTNWRQYAWRLSRRLPSTFAASSNI